MSFGNRKQGLAWERKFLRSPLAQAVGLSHLERGHRHLDHLVEEVGALEIVKSLKHDDRNKQSVSIDTDWLFQSGNLKAIDYSRVVDGSVRFGNLKFSTSDKVLSAENFIANVSAKKVEICRGTAIPLFRRLSKTSYGLMMSFPLNNGKDEFVLCEVNLAKYRQLAIHANAWMGNWDMAIGAPCPDKSSVCKDKHLHTLGLETETYGDYRRLLSETYGFDNGVLTLELKPFSRSFQSLHPCEDWNLPPVVIREVGGSFEFVRVLEL